MSTQKLLCFGLGYSANELARRLAAQGWAIAGTSRSREKRAALTAQGFAMYDFGRDMPLEDLDAALRGVTHILTSVAPDEQGDPVLDVHRGAIQAIPGLRWAGYLSSTGVYGDRRGGWVDEGSEPRATAPRGQRRIAAEADWRALDGPGLPGHVFRLAGIYGPGRSAFDQLRKGRAQRVDKPGHLFSRIHVADIATVLEASIAQPNPGAVYNVCDDEPAASADVIAEASRLLGTDPPALIPFEEARAGMSPIARGFWADNRRVRNRRIREELGVNLAYPDYRAGLAGILAGEGGG